MTNNDIILALLSVNGWQLAPFYFRLTFFMNGGFWTEDQQQQLAIYLSIRDPQPNNATAEPTLVTTQLVEPVADAASTISNGMPRVPTFLGRAIFTGCRTLLYSASKVGKSFLSIAIGCSNSFKRCVYIIIDNNGASDISRYEKNLGPKAIVFTLKNFHERADDIKAKTKNAANCKIFMECSMNPTARAQLHDAENITTRVYQQMGIADDSKKHTDFVKIFEIVMEEAIKVHKADFVCVDSLNSLVGDVRRINRELIRRITQQAADAGITFLVLHHTNSTGKMAGAEVIREEFDYIYQLAKTDEKNRLLLNEEGARYSEPQSLLLLRTFIDPDITDYKLITSREFQSDDGSLSKPSNLKDRIVQIIKDFPDGSITLAALKAALGSNPPSDGGIKAALKALADQGMIQMTNNTWAVITILNH
jgi:hypothetical protein